MKDISICKASLGQTRVQDCKNRFDLQEERPPEKKKKKKTAVLLHTEAN